MKYENNNPFLKDKIEFFSNNIYIILVIIVISAIALRLNYFDSQNPLILDALKYFWYANDLSLSGEFPVGHSIVNNGWPVFLSPFFAITNFNSFMDYMHLQKIISVILSSVTIFPLYFVLKRFVSKPYVIVGTILFAFEPRLIQNSVLGITEPLYILLGTIAILLFLQQTQKSLYSAFFVVSLCTIVRAEAMFLIPAFIIVYLWKNSKKQKDLFKLTLAIGIFILALLPMSMIRIETIGDDGLFSRVIRSTDYSLSKITESPISLNSVQENYVITGFKNFGLFLGWAMIPIFVWFTPLGFILIFKNRDFNNMTLLLVLTSLSFPIFYAFSLFSDTRYLFFFYPIFSVLSMVGLQKVSKKHKQKILFLFTILIIVLSVSFLEIKNQDNEHQKESMLIAKDVSKLTDSINAYVPDSEYIKMVSLENSEKFPITYEEFRSNHIIINNPLANSLEEYFIHTKSLKMTHLVVDDIKDSPYRYDFIQAIFDNENNYPFLKKIYDSNEFGYGYGVKVFEIDYEKFTLFTE